MERKQCLAPFEILVMHVVRLVVHNDKRIEVAHPFEHPSPLDGVAARFAPKEPVESVLRRPFASALAELLDVREEEVPAAAGLRAFTAQDHLEVKPPSRRYEWELAEDEAVL